MNDRTWMLTIAILFTALLPYMIAGGEAGTSRASGPGPTRRSAPVVPYGLGILAPSAGEVPEGWRPLAGPAAAIEGAPTEQALLALAESAGLDPAQVEVRSLALATGEGDDAQQGVVGWIAIDGEMKDFAQKITEASQTGGWKIKAVGTPMRILASWGSTEDAGLALQEWQVAAAVTRLCETAHAYLMESRNAAGGDEGDTEAARLKIAHARMMMQAAGSTEPEAAIVHALLGRLVQGQSPADALEPYRRALRPGAPIPPPDDWVVEAAYLAGQALLRRQTRHVLDEALTILRRGVVAEESAPHAQLRFGNRYNLACTYARLGQVDEAFAHLEEGLRFLRTASAEETLDPAGGGAPLDYVSNYKHALEIDTDMASLREDARWAPLMAKYAPQAKADTPPGEADPKKK